MAESQGLEAARFKCKLTLLFRTQPFPLRRKKTHTHTRTHEGDVIYWFLSGTHYTDSSQCPASLKGFMTNNIAIEGWVNKMVLTPFTEKAPEQS